MSSFSNENEVIIKCDGDGYGYGYGDQVTIDDVRKAFAEYLCTIEELGPNTFKLSFNNAGSKHLFVRSIDKITVNSKRVYLVNDLNYDDTDDDDDNSNEEEEEEDNDDDDNNNEKEDYSYEEEEEEEDSPDAPIYAPTPVTPVKKADYTVCVERMGPKPNSYIKKFFKRAKVKSIDRRFLFKDILFVAFKDEESYNYALSLKGQSQYVIRPRTEAEKSLHSKFKRNPKQQYCIRIDPGANTLVYADVHKAFSGKGPGPVTIKKKENVFEVYFASNEILKKYLRSTRVIKGKNVEIGKKANTKNVITLDDLDKDVTKEDIGEAFRGYELTSVYIHPPSYKVRFASKEDRDNAIRNYPKIFVGGKYQTPQSDKKSDVNIFVKVTDGVSNSEIKEIYTDAVSIKGSNKWCEVTFKDVNDFKKVTSTMSIGGVYCAITTVYSTIHHNTILNTPLKNSDFGNINPKLTLTSVLDKVKLPQSAKAIKFSDDHYKGKDHSPLTEEEYKALCVYTYEPSGNAAYKHINKALNENDIPTLKRIGDYVVCLLRTLRKLPRFPGGKTLYRGINCFGAQKRYSKNAKIIWRSFSSTSLNKDKALEFVKEGKEEHILFVIEGDYIGYELSNYSLCPFEEGKNNNNNLQKSFSLSLSLFAPNLCLFIYLFILFCLIQKSYLSQTRNLL